MGQHKYNPRAQAAKRGDLPRKEKPISKQEWETMVSAMIAEKTGMNQLYNAIGTAKTY